MIASALHARGGGCAESEPFSTLGLEQNMLRVPLVDLAHLHFLNLVARLDALDYLRQLSRSPFPFPHPCRRANKIQPYKRHDYKASAATFTCLVILSVLAHEKPGALVHKWGKGKE